MAVWGGVLFSYMVRSEPHEPSRECLAFFGGPRWARVVSGADCPRVGRCTGPAHASHGSGDSDLGSRGSRAELVRQVILEEPGDFFGLACWDPGSLKNQLNQTDLCSPQTWST